MTNKVSMAEHGCQTVVMRRGSQVSNDSHIVKKKVEINIALNRQTSNVSKYKKDKAKTPSKAKENKDLKETANTAAQKREKDTINV